MMNFIGGYLVAFWVAGLVLYKPPLGAWDRKILEARAGIGLLLLVAQVLLAAQFLGTLSWLGAGALPISLACEALDLVDVMIHEAGHAYTSMLGEFLHVLGGTLMQLGVPLGLAFFAFQRRYDRIFALSIFWLGVNLLAIGPYMNDARARKLPLLGDSEIHDWEYLFSRLGLLKFDVVIGNSVWWIGSGLMIAGLIIFALALRAASPREQSFDPRSVD